MPRRAAAGPLISLDLGADGPAPLHRQAYDQLRAMILAGRLAPGARLPSTRTLAREHGVARNTVTAAFDQLLVEGYLDGRHGSGTYVSAELPEALAEAQAAPGARPGATRPPTAARLSARGAALAAAGPGAYARHRAFTPGLPALDQFPFDWWARHLARVWRRPPAALPARGEAAGHAPLREAVAAYLRTVRAARCEADQVLIVSGAQQAIGLAARVLLEAGEVALVEDPGYPGLRSALLGAGVRPHPVPVDAEGMDIAAGEAVAPDARMACVVPSHQYPLGVTMSLGRRLALLDWAARRDAWVLEDDYDSEYRYGGRPLAALQGLDRRDRVLYVGTFSRVLFPALRLAYLVVPPDLVAPFRAARAALDDHPPALAQPVLAAFMAEGRFAAHVRRMRRLYATRQQALLTAAEAHLPGLLTLMADESGMHLVAHLAPALAARMTDEEASARAAAANLTTPPLTPFYLGQPDRQGLMLGYAALDEAEIEAGVARLAQVLAE